MAKVRDIFITPRVIYGTHRWFFREKAGGEGELTDVSRKSNPPPPIMRTDVGVGELITNINNLGLGCSSAH